MLKMIFQTAANGLQKASKSISLRRIFGGSVLLAPEETGSFLGSRVTGMFNGVMKGVGRGMMQNPLLIAAGATAAAWIGSDIYSKFKK